MRWCVLVFLFFTMAINFADKSIIGYAAESIMSEFNLTYTQWGLIGSSFFWLFSISGILGAAWSDRIGTKKIIAVMLASWSILQFGAFAIAGLPMLVAYRVLLGIGEGPFAPTAISHVSKWFKPESRGMAISIVNAGSMLGTLASAPILVMLIEKFGWRIGFASLGLLSLTFLVIWMLLPETHSLKVDVNHVKLAPPKFAWSEFFVILRSPTCLFTLMAAFSGVWLTMWLGLWMPSYLTKVVEMKPMQMGYTALIIGIGSIIVSVFISTLSDRLYKKNHNFRTSRIYLAGISLIVAGMFLASITIFHSPIWITIALSMAKGCAYTILAISPQVLMQLLPDRSGLMTSLSTSFMNIAGMIGPVITGVLVQSAGENVSLGFAYSILFAAGLLLIFGIVFSIFVKPDTGLCYSNELIDTKAKTSTR
ncbi:MFS transporter [Peribacillus aracenensis]|uniref:MFS transporter n=1 Tax=Peribacillus aracenensis TaxID=2976708 RepID=UPI0021A82FBA|nr:MFS transporter [Peribacillus sp. BBB004]